MEADEINNVKNALELKLWQERMKIIQIFIPLLYQLKFMINI
ncbi:unnamed protein product [marine sediment metagenome]|uniref:Uncharacterized protein n=1 Tax=marine sediment metagenome TaxID=412755 RepID=X1AMN3_9ZZZZ